VDDGIDEANETVIVNMGTPTNATQGATTTHTLTITDNDAAPTVAWTSASQSSGEGAGSVTVTAQLSATSSQNVTVPFSVGGGSTASNPADNTITTSPLSITAGNTTASLTITIVDDGIDEANETVIVSMGTPTNATQGATTTHTLTITDNDAAPTVAWTSASQSSGEGAGSVTVTAQLSATSSQNVAVPFSVGGGSTASNPADYTISASPRTILAGNLSASLSITVVNDNADESDETVIVNMGTPTNATQGAITTHTVTITDNDAAPTVAWTSASQSSGEGTASVTVTAQLSATSGQNVTVPFTVGGGSTASNPADYTISASPLTILAGNTSASLTITVVDDDIDEANETVIVNMGTPTNATLGAPSTHTLTITDNDAAPTVAWTSASQSNLESVATVTVTAQLSATSAQNVTVPFSVGGASTASNPADYTISASPLTIDAGSLSASLTITVVGDGDVEPSETLFVDMGVPTNASAVPPTTHIVTITNDDP
jgi:hypothetical protein